MNNNNELIQLDNELLDGYVQSLGAAVVKQMFDLYREQVVLYLQDIESSLLSDDAKLWQEHCHKMKGAAGSIGLKALHARLKVMEKTTADSDGKAQQLAALKIHNQQAIAKCNEWFEHI